MSDVFYQNGKEDKKPSSDVGLKVMKAGAVITGVGCALSILAPFAIALILLILSLFA
jgi:hypothetical protein